MANIILVLTLSLVTGYLIAFQLHFRNKLRKDQKLSKKLPEGTLR